MDHFWINNRYGVERELGAGGMARVYLGRDHVLNRHIAIKVLRPEVDLDALARARFEREVHFAARLAHPHIVDVYDVGEHEGTPYIVMEYVRGETLRRIIDDEAPFSPDDVAALIEQIASALDHAHDRGVIHRDVKPQNIIVNEQGVAKILDFGIAGSVDDSATHALRGQGTPAYIAPEVLAGRPPSPASDVYALGILAFEMLTGRLPFQATHATALALPHFQSEPPPPSGFNPALPSQCDSIVLNALAKQPSQRVGSAGQFATELTNWRTSTIDRDEFFAYEQDRRSDRTEKFVPASSPTMQSLAHVERISAMQRKDNDPPLPSIRPQRTRPWLFSLGLVVSMLIALLVTRPFDNLASTINSATWNPFGSPATTPPSTEGTGINAPAPPDVSRQGVPDVRGLSIESARQLLAEQGLSLREDPPVFSRGVTAGEIAEQDPPAGSALGFGETVFIKASRGPAETALNTLSLEGQSADLARQHLANLGLEVEQRDVGSRTAPVGTVIEVETSAVASAADSVTLIVSIGDKVQVPPDTFGSSVATAVTQLNSTGLTVSEPIPVDRATIERQVDFEQMDIRPGDVVGVQNADGSANFGAWLDRGATITLVYYDPSLD